MAKSMKADQNHRSGITIVEILIAIVVLGILMTIGYVSYRGVERQAQNVQRQSDIKIVEAELEAYAIRHDGQYPATTANAVANWKTIDVRTDLKCFNGSSQIDWVPELSPIPQSIPNTGAATGVDGSSGCYLYASNGTHFVLSAWNMVASPHTDPVFYRRLGFRTFQTATSTQFYTCNDNVTGGANGGYDVTRDYYKHSYTISNVTDCDETPPPGA